MKKIKLLNMPNEFLKFKKFKISTKKQTNEIQELTSKIDAFSSENNQLLNQ